MARIKHGKDEYLVDMNYWMKDGCSAWVPSASPTPKKNRPTVDIGRTDSKYGLGFWVNEDHNYVLNREQVIVLRDYLTFSIARLKPSGARRGINIARLVHKGFKAKKK